MNVFDGVNLNKLNGNLSESAPGDDNVAMLIYAIATADLPAGTAHNTLYPLLQKQDAKDLGFSESHDANEHVWLYGAIDEFFDYAPEGVLYLVTVNTGSSALTILGTDAIKTAIRSAPKVKGIAIGGTAETPVELADDVEDIQEIIAGFATEHRLIDFVLLQGNQKASPDDWAIADLIDMRTKNAPNVTICIGQDPYVAGLDAAYESLADIGSALGMLMVRKVNENLGSVDILKKPDAFKADKDYTLSRGHRWQKAQLSNGVDISTLSGTTQTAISDKGYIFVGSYEGYTGMFFNDSPTSVEATSDYNSIENNRTWNKAARLVRNALLPRVKSTVKKDPVTGFIRSTVIGYWVGICNKALDAMVNAEEISGYSVNISANQLPSRTNPVKAKIQVVKDGIAFGFDIDLGLANNI